MKKNKKPYVILLVPVFNVSKRFKEWAECIYNLKPKPNKVIFAENNSKDNTLELIKDFKLPHEIIRVWFKDDAQQVLGPYANIANIRQLLLTKARSIDPDYAIFVDDDVFIMSTDAIKTIISYKKDIVGGAYLRWYPEGTFLASKWRLHNDQIQLRDWVDLPIQEVEMTSGGFLCLSRRIIQDENMDFYPIKDNESSEDYGYCVLAKKYNYKTYLNGTIKLEHADRHKHRPWFLNKEEDKEHASVKIGELNYIKYSFVDDTDDYIKTRLIPIYCKPE